MTALATGRDTHRHGSELQNKYPYLVAASQTIYPGAIVMLDAGYAKPGATASGKKCIGVCQNNKPVVSTSVAGSATVEVFRFGVFEFNNSSGDPVAQADVGATVYIEDDNTICKTASGKTAAGEFCGFSNDTNLPMVIIL